MMALDGPASAERRQGTHGIRGRDEDADRVLHVIVGGRPPAPGRIRFRRDRFAEFLAAEPTTAGVLVLEPGYRQAAAVTLRAEPAPLFRYYGLRDYRNLLSYGGTVLRPRFGPVLRQIRQVDAARRILWYTKPIYPELADRLGWDAVVYDCSDYWSRRGNDRNVIARWNGPRGARSEARIVTTSDLLLASSSFLAERVRSEFGRDVSLMENGVDFDLFAGPAGETPSDIADLPSPRLGFVGALKGHKIDFSLLLRVAEAHPHWSFVLIGPDEASTHRDGDFAPLCRLPNVRWLGTRAGVDLPRYLRGLDVGLLPYREAAYNQGVFPLKFFEYLAAGLPVVGCGLPSTVGYAEHGVYSHTRSSAEEFSRECENALGWADSHERRREIAADADWDRRFRAMLDTALKCTRAQPRSISIAAGSDQVQRRKEAPEPPHQAAAPPRLPVR